MRFARARSIATLALAVFVATLCLPLAASGHGLGDDLDAGWGGTRVGFGHPLTQVEPVSPAGAGEHCAICHWARVLGSSVTGVPVRYVPSVTVFAIVMAPLDAASTVSLAVGPPRGPPSVV